MALRPLSPVVVSHDLPDVTMWKEDIVEMVDVFLEGVPEGRSIVIEADGYSMDRIEEIEQLPELMISKVLVHDTTNSFMLCLSRYKCFVAVRDPDLKMRGMITEVQKIALKYRRSRLTRIVRSPWFWLAQFAIFFGFIRMHAVANSKTLSDTILPAWPAILTGSAIGLLVVVCLFLARVHQSILRSRSRVEAPTFWMRKKDDLAITLASNSISLLLGGVIGYWINILTK